MTFIKQAAIAITLGFCVPTAALAQTVRQHDAHEHGVVELNIAIDGDKVQFLLEAPGSDIVGFEHQPSSEQDKSSVADALLLLKQPSKLFKFPTAAGCTTLSIDAEFSADGEHEDEDGEAHKGEKHEGEEHEEHKSAEHKGEEHEGEEHKDEEHEGEEGHSEFHANYVFRCDSVKALSTIEIGFFELFPKSEEIELKAVSDMGQHLVEISKDRKSINLSDILK